MSRSRFLGFLLALALVGCQSTQSPTAVPTVPPIPTPAPTPTASPTPTIGSTPTPSPTPTPSLAPSPLPTTKLSGGTLYLLVSDTSANGGVSLQGMDPQRVSAREDLAFLGATMIRSLTAYRYSPDVIEGTSLVPDAATDTGTPLNDGTVWQFTIRDGMKWQGGSPVTCADFRYGVSRNYQRDVLFNGLTYAVRYLDIPFNADGSSQYPGPYTATPQQQALFDRAVTCDGNTITFHLNQPVGDFNYTVSMGFGAVPNPVNHPSVDTRELYDTAPWSDGPYMIQSFSPGVGGSLVLIRNPYWSTAVDDYRGAYPDKWEVDFAIDPAVLDQRLMQPTGNDQFALQYGSIQPANLATIFTDAHTTAPEFVGRAFSDYDAYTHYAWIDTTKVPNQQIRQAMAVALDREAMRDAVGGEFVGDYADGVLKPNIGLDYAPTHLWDAQGPFGEDVPATGDPALARQLIEQSGEDAPTLTWVYQSGTVSDKVASIVKRSLQAAGFTVKLIPTPFSYPSSYTPPEPQEFGAAGWGPDWPNASTVIPVLFTDVASFDMSHVDSNNYPEFEAGIQDATGTVNQQQQAQEWQAFDQEAAEQMFAIPTLWDLTQTIAGGGVGNLYRWPAYDSWPYAQLYARQ